MSILSAITTKGVNKITSSKYMSKYEKPMQEGDVRIDSNWFYFLIISNFHGVIGIIDESPDVGECQSSELEDTTLVERYYGSKKGMLLKFIEKYV